MRAASALTLAAVVLLGVFAFSSLVTSSYAAGGGAPATTSTECVPASDPFVVTAAAWGTQTSAFSAGPGDLDVPLTVTLLYTGGCALTGASFELELSQPFAASDGSNTTTTYEVNTATDSILSETYYLNIAANAALETYHLPVYIGYNTSNFAGVFFESANFSIALRGSVSLLISANTTNLVPGRLNSLTVTIANEGTGQATSVSTSVQTSSQVGVLDQIPEIQTLGPDSTSVQMLEVFVPSTMSGSALDLTFTTSYYDAYITPATSTQVLGFSVLTPQADTSSLGVSVVNDTSIIGAQTSLEFILENEGESTVYTPSLSVSSTTPVVMGVSPSNYTSALPPGGSIAYTVTVESGPSTTSGVYSGTITLTYSDAGGTQHTQTLPVGFVVVGAAQFVLQDVTVSQTATSITVSGSILNEGSGTAYYAQVAGAVGSGSSPSEPSYIGEIDVNTPTPFTLSIPYPAPSSPRNGAVISLTFTYKNSFGTAASYAGSASANLESEAQLAFSSETSSGSSGSTGGALVAIVSYIVVIVIIAAVVGSALYIRRKRPKDESEGKVI